MPRNYSRKRVSSSIGRTSGGELSKLKESFRNRLHEAGGVLLAFFAFYLLLSLISYHPDDPSWANTHSRDDIRNLGGMAGAWIAYGFYFLFGKAAFALPVGVLAAAWRAFRHRGNPVALHLTQGVGYLLALLTLCGLVSMHFVSQTMPASAGGRLGELTAHGFVSVFGPVGATVLLLALFIGSVHLITTLSWLKVMDATGAALLRASEFAVETVRNFRDKRAGREVKEQRETLLTQRRKQLEKRRRKAPRIEPRVDTVRVSKRLKKEKQVTLHVGESGAELPPIESLDRPGEKVRGLPEDTIKAMAKQLEIKLGDFDVEAEVVGARSGPVITRFELMPSPGTKASRITSLEKDLARALSVPSVRVVEVIPGKSTIGIEVPNETRETVLLSEILSSEDYDRKRSPLTLGLGKDISGEPVLIDLERMPHLLVAGTTGSGKSVAVHSMLMSILFKASPQEVRLILIDPKMLELNTYEGIPHLLTPVITDMKHAAGALKWAVAEMERRYRLMSALAVRNIGGYNRKVAHAESEGKPLSDPLREEGDETPLEALPYVVVVVDEFADMMMIVGKRIEELIARLAQKARAAGIHLLLATQRPSVDVITGLIKANIPARIAFQVSSKVDSRTILDQGGAEQLLGQGDMLYVSPGTSSAERVHGAFVSDQEVHKVTEFLKKQGEAEYIELEQADSALPGEREDEETPDPLYDQAVALVVESRKASISYVQRRFRIGYNRAARMIEDMEAAGIVSPVQANGAREVLSPPPS